MAVTSSSVMRATRAFCGADDTLCVVLAKHGVVAVVGSGSQR